MLALDNDQLAIIMMAESSLPPEKRSVFLERIAARLQLRGRRFTDADLDNAIRIALQGLIHNSVASRHPPSEPRKTMASRWPSCSTTRMANDDHIAQLMIGSRCLERVA